MTKLIALKVGLFVSCPPAVYVNMSSKVTCFVNSGSLEAYASSVTAQQKEDVLHSSLLAQLLSDEKFSRDDERWYGEYLTTLINIGWSVGQADFQQYTPSGIYFTVDKAIEDIVDAGSKSLVGELIIKVRSHKLTDKSLRLFHKNACKGDAMAFQVLSTRADDSASVSVSLVSFNIQGTQQWMKRVAAMNAYVSSFMFAHHPTLLTSVSYDVQTIKLYDSNYKPHRQFVMKTLREKTTSSFLEL